MYSQENIYLISPTGGGVRNDSGGSGYFLAKRGTRLHQGVDYELPDGVGQLVVAPITGRIERIAYPYSDTQDFTGCVLRGDDIWIKMFYFRPYDALIGQRVTMAQPIGIAQDISKRYKDVTPHVHLEIIKINPEILRSK